jgi:hypothetical protein
VSKIGSTGARMLACVKTTPAPKSQSRRRPGPLTQCSLRHPSAPPRKLWRLERLHRGGRRRRIFRLSAYHAPFMNPNQKTLPCAGPKQEAPCHVVRGSVTGVSRQNMKKCRCVRCDTP